MTDKEGSDPINQILEKAKPLGAKLSFGSIVGYCSGAAAKKIGRAVAVICGLGFILVQSGTPIFLLYDSMSFHSPQSGMGCCT